MGNEKKAPAKRGEEHEDDLAELQKRYGDLSTKKTVAETELKNATQQLEKLQKEARERYETDDLEQLKAKLQQLKEENERKLNEYRQHLDGIEKGLTQIEQEYAEIEKSQS
jgi:chromosome segregation ATPase